jgi:hypothetical protein
MASEVLNRHRTRTDAMGISLAFFVGGAAVGAIAALLLVPQAGRGVVQTAS